MLDHINSWGDYRHRIREFDAVLEHGKAVATVWASAPEATVGRFDVVVVGYHPTFDYQRMDTASAAVRAGARRRRHHGRQLIADQRRCRRAADRQRASGWERRWPPSRVPSKTSF